MIDRPITASKTETRPNHDGHGGFFADRVRASVARPRPRVALDDPGPPRQPQAEPAVVGVVRLTRLRRQRDARTWTWLIDFVVGGQSYSLRMDLDPLIDFSEFRRHAAKRCGVIARHAAETGTTAGRRKWMDELQRAAEAGAGADREHDDGEGQG